MRKRIKIVRFKRERPQKKIREPVRRARAEVICIKPDPCRSFQVRVWVSPTRIQMRATSRFITGQDLGNETRGAVITRGSSLRKTQRVLNGKYTCYMFLNAKDLSIAPAELVAHECGHAAMAWARQQKANLKISDGEETMCYALGRMTQSLCNKLNKRGYFAR